MNVNIQDLEKQLEELKQQQIKQEKEAAIKAASEFIGKCYSTHMFGRVPRPGKMVHIRKITGVEYTDKIIYKHRQINYTHWHDIFKVEVVEGHSAELFPSWIGNWSYELSSDIFDEIERQIKAHADGYFDTISATLKRVDYITNGDSDEDCGKYKWVEKLGHTFIDLPEKVYQFLSWEKHPFIYDNKLLNTNESVELIKIIADKLIEDAKGWGGNIYERDSERYKILMDFYNKLKS